jgi:hypothetical protein
MESVVLSKVENHAQTARHGCRRWYQQRWPHVAAPRLPAMIWDHLSAV